MQQEQPGSPPPWHWMLSIERRLTRVEVKVQDLGAKIMAPKDGDRTWRPRDTMMAASGIVMVLAALSERVGWTAVIAGLVRLYGGK